MILEISSMQAKIYLASTKDISESILNLRFAFNYIPELQIKSVLKVQAEGNYFLNINQGKDFDINYENKTLNICINDKITTEDIVTLIDYFLEYVRQSLGIYCLHGDAIGKENKGVILFGELSGIGKSTVAATLVNNFGFSLIGDEKVLINEELNILGGIKEVTSNKDIQKPFISENKHHTLSSQISLIVQPITNLNGKLYVDAWDKSKAEFHLYEELSRKIRGVSRRVANFTIPVKSIDTYSIALRRSQYCKNLAGSVKSYCIYGDPKEVANQINLLIDKV